MWRASEVTDAGVAHLAGLDKLKEFHLRESQITDDSLRTLARLPALENMTLQRNRRERAVKLAYVRTVGQAGHLAIA